jgi:hypothetical protein
MKTNMGTFDRIIRLILVAIIAILYFSNVITGTVGIVLMALAAIFVLTSLMGFCPLYTLVGLKTTSSQDTQ